MPLINKPFGDFQNGTQSDANALDQQINALYNLVNGQQDDANLKAGSIKNAIATEGVTPDKTEGLPYAKDLFTSSFVYSGLVATKDGTNAKQVDVSAGIVYILQTDGSLRRLSIAAYTAQIAFPNTTYYLDLNPDGTFSWAGTHSTQANYIPICTVTSDASSNVSTIIDSRPLTINFLNSAAGAINMTTIDSQNLRALLVMGGF